MEDLPENVYDVIISFIPRDRDQRSPTVKIIRPWVNFYREILEEHGIPEGWANRCKFQEFVKDPLGFLDEEFQLHL